MISDIQQREIENAILALKEGGVILYPTDTIWGIGCDATNSKAVEKIFHIKRREKNKSMIVLMENIEQLKSYVNKIPSLAYDFLSSSDCPLTIIYPEARMLAENVIADDRSIAIRIPGNDFCLQLIKAFGKPIVSTSANLSGEPSAVSFEKISIDLLPQMDYVVQTHHNQIIEGKPSRIIKLNQDGSFIVIRE